LPHELLLIALFPSGLDQVDPVETHRAALGCTFACVGEGSANWNEKCQASQKKLSFFKLGEIFARRRGPGVLPVQLVYLPVTKPGVELPVFARHEYRTWELDKWAVRSAARRWS
jgi:hypothetical protein